MKWRYHVYGKDNKVEKVSEYIYDTEKAALADAAEYVRKNRTPNSTDSWHAVASHN
jgi:hypothetical protein